MRNIALLFLCEAFSRTGSIIVLSSMAIIGRDLTPYPGLATMPLALAPISTMLTTIPAARFMQRRGRKAGFALGACLGILGGLTGFAALYHAHFVLLCLAAIGIGMVNGFSTYYRFAAAEVVDEAWRSRAISLVMAGGIIAAVAGSNLATWSRNIFPEHLFAGSYLAIAAIQGLVLTVLFFVRFPTPSTAESSGGGRPLTEISRDANFALAIVGAVASWAVMSLLMNATPLSMQRHMHSFDDTAWVIQWHVLGMFVPSFFTGHLVKRFGERLIMAVGLALLAASALTNLGGVALHNYVVGLTLLGLGWNFLFVGSTSLLATTYRPEEKARVQSANDFLIYGLMVLTTFGAAPLEQAVGWEMLNKMALPLLAAIAALMWHFNRQAKLNPAATH
ncbi:MAG: MFS transporter [Candidatus Latescibacterota bacterium]